MVGDGFLTLGLFIKIFKKENSTQKMYNLKEVYNE